ncbi:MAG TPA: lysophospholipid acyltransferase family protein [Candidatus Aphodousia gallistercoris]|nr:lysophospholipid acyltransferase family protein [Candidatus Aphodousia gallistercoris]
MKVLIYLISRIPLSVLRALSTFLGRMLYRCAPKYRQRIKENLERAGIYSEEMGLEVAGQQAIQAVEAPWVWGRGRQAVLKLTRGEAKTVELIDEAVKSGRSIIFLTPHIGCYEVAPMWVAEHWLKESARQFAVLYRVPRKSYLRSVVGLGRVSENVVPASADLKGVRQIIKILRTGGIVGILPDQVPSHGEGVWVPLFGEQAYTMTFPLRLASQFKAVVIMAKALRDESGWCIHCKKWDYELTGNAHEDAAAMNRLIEQTVLENPQQYLWSYNRYKCPSGVQRPEQ